MAVTDEDVPYGGCGDEDASLEDPSTQLRLFLF